MSVLKNEASNQLNILEFTFTGDALLTLFNLPDDNCEAYYRQLEHNEQDLEEYFKSIGEAGSVYVLDKKSLMPHNGDKGCFGSLLMKEVYDIMMYFRKDWESAEKVYYKDEAKRYQKMLYDDRFKRPETPYLYLRFL